MLAGHANYCSSHDCIPWPQAQGLRCNSCSYKDCQFCARGSSGGRPTCASIAGSSVPPETSLTMWAPAAIASRATEA